MQRKTITLKDGATLTRLVPGEIGELARAALQRMLDDARRDHEAPDAAEARRRLYEYMNCG